MATAELQPAPEKPKAPQSLLDDVTDYLSIYLSDKNHATKKEVLVILTDAFRGDYGFSSEVITSHPAFVALPDGHDTDEGDAEGVAQAEAKSQTEPPTPVSTPSK